MEIIHSLPHKVETLIRVHTIGYEFMVNTPLVIASFVNISLETCSTTITIRVGSCDIFSNCKTLSPSKVINIARINRVAMNDGEQSSSAMTSRDSSMTSRDSSVPMETQEDSVVCKNTVSSGNVVYLHPLVAMNIADHATRYKINNKDHQYGELLVFIGCHALFVMVGFNQFDHRKIGVCISKS